MAIAPSSLEWAGFQVREDQLDPLKSEFGGTEPVFPTQKPELVK